MPSTDQSRTDLVALDQAITRANRLVLGAIVLAVLIYFAWFFLLNNKVLSDTSDAWGQFGDFLGGLLNPLVAYSAFYWLTRSVRLQKEELLETRVALQEAADSAARQADYSQVQVRVAALTALINSIMTEVQTQRMQLEFILGQSSMEQGVGGRLLDGTFKSSADMTNQIAAINQQISKRMLERFNYEVELVDLLARHRVAA